MSFKIGDEVVMMNEDKHNGLPMFYPKVGTVGTIKSICRDTLTVDWPPHSVDRNAWEESYTWLVNEKFVVLRSEYEKNQKNTDENLISENEKLRKEIEQLKKDKEELTNKIAAMTTEIVNIKRIVKKILDV